MNMINKTHAIVLRVSPYSQSSHIVTWLTPEEGKLTTIIKGAQRPKSSFLGQYDLFYTCELLYYVRETNGMHIARECCPLRTRSTFRRDWKSAACASYIADLLARVSYSGNHQPELYELAESSLEYLASNGAKLALIFWFELRLAELLGFAPQMNRCFSCGKSPASNENLLFSSGGGGLICHQCSESANTGRQAGKIYSISPDIVAILRNWQTATSPKTVRNISLTEHQLLDLQEILGTFLSFHTDTQPVSRAQAAKTVGYSQL